MENRLLPFEGFLADEAATVVEKLVEAGVDPDLAIAVTEVAAGGDDTAIYDLPSKNEKSEIPWTTE